MSLSLWSTPLGDATGTGVGNHESSVTALNFFSAVASTELQLYTSFALDLQRQSVRVAGRGGHAIIEIGVLRQEHKQLVAVKRSRKSSQMELGGNEQEGVAKDFDQLTRELCILGHHVLRKHPNVIDVLGVCIDEFSSSPALALVLEYSSSGTLAAFLREDTRDVDAAQKLDFIRQASQGLDALHRLQVCHGDVKIENTLVFSRQDSTWLLKISDFGQSVIAAHDDPHGRVPCPVGTRLLEAPELRRGSALKNPHFDIDAAMRTDTFSFGLFIWEVMKTGQRFFDLAWLGHDPRGQDVDSMEDFLNSVAENELIALALSFSHNFEAPENIRTRFRTALQDCLREEATSRIQMSKLAASLQDETGPSEEDTSSDGSSSDFLELLFNGSVAAWTARNSLYEILDNALILGTHILSGLPLELRLRILSELKLLATSEAISKRTRAHAAMTVSECYTVAFGDVFSKEEVLAWLHMAASLGFDKAELWYYRVVAAAGLEPTVITSNVADGLLMERELSSVPAERYLVERIHRLNRRAVETARDTPGLVDLVACPGPSMQSAMKLSIFNNFEVDDLTPLHVAAWLGRDDLLADILEHTPREAKSSLGFNAVHFACLGGHVSTLKYLLERDVPLVPAEFHHISPLHLIIFFRVDDLSAAISLLGSEDIEESSTGVIKLDAHDITLSGTPLRWAITARYRDLVRLLLPQYSTVESVCIFKALEHFYWDILEELLPRFLDGVNASHASNDFTRPQIIRRPFSHWIIHGSDYADAISKTVRLCFHYDLIGFCDDGSSHLQNLICNAVTEDDFCVIEEVLSNSSASYVKYRTPGMLGRSALDMALQRAGRQAAWTGTLERLAQFYTIEELEAPASVFSGDYLSEAVSNDSVVGARVLLERGVDVNKPHAVAGRVLTTAIHGAIEARASVEMLSLLVEFGADLLGKDPIARLSPLEWLLSGRFQSDTKLNILLQREFPEEVYIETLHTTLCLQSNGHMVSPKKARTDPELRADSSNQIRRLLTHPRFARYIDSPGRSGTTMLQQAAYALHGPSVRLLLDHGADASIPFRQGQLSALPLQLACAMARSFFATDLSDPDDVVSQDRKSQAMEVAVELLRWHVARGDNLFAGITELHLACRMCIPSDAERLLAREKSPLTAKGWWPGVDGPLTAKELIILDIKADQDAVAAFPPPGSGFEDPTEEATNLLTQDVNSDASSSTDSETLEYEAGVHSE